MSRVAVGVRVTVVSRVFIVRLYNYMYRVASRRIIIVYRIPIVLSYRYNFALPSATARYTVRSRVYAFLTAHVASQ